MINVLAHKTLLAAFSRKQTRPRPADVRRAWRDSRPEAGSLPARLAPVAATAAVLALVAVSAWSLL